MIMALSRILQIFQSTPSVGRATIFELFHTQTHCDFNPRPPWGGRLNHRQLNNQTTYISIHALRGEGDIFFARPNRYKLHFNPRPPWGGRLLSRFSLILAIYFNPRPPWGGRRSISSLRKRRVLFQSTPSVGRATISDGQLRVLDAPISIHALRGEGDLTAILGFVGIAVFQSTPSVGRATHRFFEEG